MYRKLGVAFGSGIFRCSKCDVYILTRRMRRETFQTLFARVFLSNYLRFSLNAHIFWQQSVMKSSAS